MRTHIDDVVVDATISEAPEYSNLITDKPVEDGGAISDHVENEPLVLPLECTITGEYGQNAEDKYERLLEITQEKEVVEVVAALEVYENMVVEDFNPEKTSEIENGFRCDITFKQIRTVEPETIEVNLGEDPVTGNQAQGEEEEIENREPDEEDVDEETASSLFYNIFYGGGDEDA